MLATNTLGENLQEARHCLPRMHIACVFIVRVGIKDESTGALPADTQGRNRRSLLARLNVKPYCRT